jgi:hypothetical protein
MDPGWKLNSAKPDISMIVDYTNKLAYLLLFSCFGRLNIKNRLNLVTYSLNVLSGDAVSQVFYLFCKEFRFGDVHSHPSG